MNEMEVEARVKPLSYKVKAISRESPSQKASHVLDIDLRNHWSTATNTKEWILLELDEPCLLSHIRIYNKSVLEWEISVGLRYKPETFIKARPRCEAPRRDMLYPINYTACRYVRISCLRGNPIAIFFIQLIGVPVIGLEPEFQPVINHLLPHITSHKHDAEDIHLQLLQDLTNRLMTFLPQLEADLNSFPDAPETTLRFLAMLAGPFYPILHILNERETAKSSSNALEIEASKNSLPSPALTVSSNFEPRRSRNTISTFSHTATPTVFRPDAILLLLRKAYKDSHLGTVCRTASRVLLKLEHPNIHEGTVDDKDPSSESFHAHDYSNLFGEEFRVTDDHWDLRYLQLLDMKAVEEGILHVLFACASQPLLCSKLAGNSSEFWSTLPLIQALLPALRPNFSSSGQVDDSFSAWRQPFVQHALSQVVVTSTSPLYRPLLHGCAGYLSSFSPSHVKAACVLIDLCTGVLGPWIGQVIAKMDLAVELIEDLLGVIHGARPAIADARAALKYIILALSGHMDDVMARYKDVKHQILFLVEMLDPLIDPALTPLKSMIAFGNVSPIFHDNQEQNCTGALNIIKTAVTKSAILPSLEFEWRRGSVAPIVLLSILEPHMHLPPNVELGKPQRTDVSLNEKITDQDDSDDVKLETFDDVVMESCKTFLIERLQVSGIIPIDENSESHSLFLIDAFQSHIGNRNPHHLSVEQVSEFSKNLEILISKLNPTIELCWKLHFQPAKKLTATSAQCFVYSRCLASVLDKDSVDNFHWKTSLAQLAETVVKLQENSCWEVASTVIDCILDGPRFLGLDQVIGPLCLAMKKFSQSAPKVSWRLQTDKWLSSLFDGKIQSLLDSQLLLVDLLSSMMSHIEPEQRFTAIKHLGQLVSQEADSEPCDESILSCIVSNTWDRIVVLASSDTSSLLRTHALALLVKCVPFAERPQLQSVLGAADNFLPCLVNLGQQTCEGPFMQLSLALIATICLYSPVEDVSLIPQNIWKNFETLGLSKTGKHEDLVQSACRALCKLKSEGDEAKGILKGVLTSNIPKQEESDFASTRESLLQVLANLTSVQSYFDFFSKKTDEKLMETQEAEIELDLIRKEQSVNESSNDLTDWRKIPFLANYGKEDKRLQEIKDEIESLEKEKLKEEIVARRQKKLLVRRARQKYLEEIALHEAELLQELDRERAAEMENEIERQKMLAVERAKTSELQHNLDMEKEKRTQRELQRELEQAESGLRPGSRREFSSNSSRPRERYRERDNGRPTNDSTNPSSSSMPRQFSGQPPTLLQARDEGDEENFEGSRDSGDTGSLGEADLVMALEGQSGQRRGNKSRQMRERREGKWERRH
ncbi:putative Galactose-binding-like domain superfamily, armadillo-like helical [Helianthus annuus]|nr:putative Galactose-binding-like domain superfamily, armadillo-like helical [Helianthus annuus]KAJ0574429.1 putative Galactose-binding-like domain superfamily, armadillo-like helical [Helianthus annuus]KAJ0738765.1 putative Galactose-binding-like domain superfamily, armadillo-like helical [Helianthus annuus]